MKPNIEKLIEESGLRKNFVAEKIGVNYRQLRNYETGKSLIPIDKAFKLAALLGVKVDDLYDYEEVEEEKHEPQIVEIELLNLQPRIFQLLKKRGINTVGDLLNTDLKTIPRLGPKSIQEIEDKLKEIK